MRNAQHTKKRSKPDYVPLFESEQVKVDSKRQRQEEKDNTQEIEENVAMDVEPDTERVYPQPFQPTVSVGVATSILKQDGSSPPSPPHQHKHTKSGRGHRPPSQAHGVDAASPEDGRISPLLHATACTAMPLVAFHREAPTHNAHTSTRVKRPTLEHEVIMVKKAEDEHVKRCDTVPKLLKNRLVVLVVVIAATVVAAAPLVLWWSGRSRVAPPPRRHLWPTSNEAHAESCLRAAPQAALEGATATAAPTGVQTEDRPHCAADAVTATLEGDFNDVADDHATSNPTADTLRTATEDAYLIGASLGGAYPSVEVVGAMEAAAGGLQGTGLQESDGLRGGDILITEGGSGEEKEGSVTSVAALQPVMPPESSEAVVGAALSEVAEGVGAGKKLTLDESISSQSAVDTVTDHEAAALARLEGVQQHSGSGGFQEAQVPPAVDVTDGCVVVRQEELSMMVTAAAPGDEEAAVVTVVEARMRHADGRNAEELNACAEHKPGEPDGATTFMTQPTLARSGEAPITEDAGVELAEGRERAIKESVRQTVPDHTPEGGTEQQQNQEPFLLLAAELEHESRTSDGLVAAVVVTDAGVVSLLEGPVDASSASITFAIASRALEDDNWMTIMPESQVEVEDAKAAPSATGDRTAAGPPEREGSGAKCVPDAALKLGERLELQGPARSLTVMEGSGSRESLVMLGSTSRWEVEQTAEDRAADAGSKEDGRDEKGDGGMRAGASELRDQAWPVRTSVLADSSLLELLVVDSKGPAVRPAEAAAHGVTLAEALSPEGGVLHEQSPSAAPAHTVEQSSTAEERVEARCVSLIGAVAGLHADATTAPTEGRDSVDSELAIDIEFAEPCPGVMVTGAIVDGVGPSATPTDRATAGKSGAVSARDTRETMGTEIAESDAPTARIASALPEVSAAATGVAAGCPLQVERIGGHTSLEVTGEAGLIAVAYATMSTPSDYVDHLSSKGADSQPTTSREVPAVISTVGAAMAASLRAVDGPSVPDAIAVEGVHEAVGRAATPMKVPTTKAQLHHAHQADGSAGPVAEDTIGGEAAVSTTGESSMPPVADASQRGGEALLATEDGAHGTGPAAVADVRMLPSIKLPADEHDVLMTQSWRKRRARVPRSDSTNARVDEDVIGAQQRQQEATKGVGDHPDEWAIVGLLHKLDYHALHLHHMGYELLIAGMAAAIAGGVVLVTFDLI